MTNTVGYVGDMLHTDYVLKEGDLILETKSDKTEEIFIITKIPDAIIKGNTEHHQRIILISLSTGEKWPYWGFSGNVTLKTLRDCGYMSRYTLITRGEITIYPCTNH